jgi:c-di-GMP-binding flagellar brake protein YcgR
MLPISIYSDYVKDDCLHVNFNFKLPLQEVSHQLLSRRVFFRALFLARRHYPRLSCHYPITIHHDEQNMIGQAIDIGLGGMGIIVPLQLSKGNKVHIYLQLKNPVIDWHVEALIVVKSHIKNNNYSYGLYFKNLKKSESQQLSKVLTHIKNHKSNKSTHYWTPT